MKKGSRRSDFPFLPLGAAVDGVREGGLEPPSLSAPDPKSGASASFATLARSKDSANTHGVVSVNVTPIVYTPGLSVVQFTTGRMYTVVGVPAPAEPESSVELI